MVRELHWQIGDVPMSNRTIVFNNVNGLEEHGIYVDQVQRNPPEKENHTIDIPYMDGEYDFDRIIGKATYKPRTLVYTCQIIEDSRMGLDDRLAAILQWLLTPVEAILQDTGTPKYHWRGKCIGIVVGEDVDYAELTITFQVYPYKISNQSVAEIEWDTFNFETDNMPTQHFVVDRTGTINLWNDGMAPVDADFTTDAIVIFTVDGHEYRESGSGKLRFQLMPGDNMIEVRTINEEYAVLDFDWTKEFL